MIQVKTYQQQVTPANMPVASPSPTKVPADAFGVGLAETGAKVGKEISEAGGLLAKHMIARQEQRDNADVLSNDLKIQKDLQDLLYNQESGLLNKQGLDADGITKTYDAKAQEIFAKHIANLPGENQRISAQRLFDSHALALRGQLVPHEAKEVRAGNMSVLDNNLRESLSILANNPTAIGNMDSALGILEARKPEIVKLVGNDGYNQLLTKQMSAFGVATIKALAESGNIEGANAALDKHGKNMTPAAVAEARSIITNKKGTFDVFATVDAMKNDPSLKNPDGSPNLEKGLAAIEAKYGIKAGAGKGAKPFENPAEVDKTLISKWITNTAGGNLDGMNQTLLTRVAKLAAKDGKTVNVAKHQGFRSRQDQEELFAQSDGSGKMVAKPGSSRHETGFALDDTYFESKTDAELAAVGLYRPMDYEPWHVELIETKGMSTDQLRSGGGGTGGGFDETKYNKAVALWKSEIATFEAKKAQEFEGIQSQIVEWVKANKNPTTASVVNFVDSMGIKDGAKYAKALQFTQTMTGLTNVKTNPIAYGEARRLIESGMTYSQAILQFPDQISAKDGEGLRNYEALMVKHNAQAIVGKLWKESKLDQKENAGLQLQVMEKVMQEVKTWSDKPENKGKQITQTDIARIFQDQIGEVVVRRNIFGGASEKARLAQIPYWMKIDGETPYIEINGVKVRPTEYDKKTRKWYTYYQGQKVEIVEGGLKPVK